MGCGVSCACGGEVAGGTGAGGSRLCLLRASVSPWRGGWAAFWGDSRWSLTAPPPPKLAHAIRLLLEYTETPYEDKLYSCGEGEGGRD